MQEKVLKLIESKPDKWWHVTEIQSKLGLSRTCANYHLRNLTLKWKMLERTPVVVKGKVTYLYRLKKSKGPRPALTNLPRPIVRK